MMLAASWISGDTITTTSDRTHHSETKHLLKRAVRVSNLRAPHTTRLPKMTMKNTKSKPANSHYE